MKFLKKSHHRDFINKGYLVIKNFLDKDTLSSFSEYYHQLPTSDLNFYTSNWIKDKSLKEEIHQFLKPVLQQKLSAIAEGYHPIFAYYLTKKSAENTKITIHQDWALVDESMYFGFNVWIPMVDTDEKNGCFHLIPYSHRIFTNIRGSNMDMPYIKIGPMLEQKCMKSIPLKAGDALIFDHRMVHYSPPNLSGNERIVVGLTTVPEGVPLIHYFKKSESAKEVYKIDVNHRFLLDFTFNDEIENFAGLSAKKIGLVLEKDYQLNKIRFSLLKMRLFDGF